MKNVEEVDGEKIKTLRKNLRLPQYIFWPAIGVSQPSGCRYETEMGSNIPEPVRILLFARYVLGLPVENTPEGIDAMRKLAKIQNKTAKSEPIANAI